MWTSSGKLVTVLVQGAAYLFNCQVPFESQVLLKHNLCSLHKRSWIAGSVKDFSILLSTQNDLLDLTSRTWLLYFFGGEFSVNGNGSTVHDFFKEFELAGRHNRPAPAEFQSSASFSTESCVWLIDNMYWKVKRCQYDLRTRFLVIHFDNTRGTYNEVASEHY